MPVRRCATCRTALPPQAGRGHPRWYCSARCRRAAEFARRRAVTVQRQAERWDYWSRFFNLT